MHLPRPLRRDHPHDATVSVLQLLDEIEFRLHLLFFKNTLI